MKANWDAQSNEIFIRVCVEHLKANNRNVTYPNNRRWNAVIDGFKRATGSLHNKIQTENHWEVLKKDWLLWNDLLKGESGLVRDAVSNRCF